MSERDSGTYSNILERAERAENNLEDMSRTLRALTETLPDLVMRVSRDGYLIDFLAGSAFPAVDQLQQFVGEDFVSFARQFMVGPKDVRSATLEAFKRGVAADEPRMFEAEVFVLDDRGRAPVEVRFFPLQNESIVILRDITDKQELQNKLALTEKLASLGSVAAGVGHEINNPLTWVSSNLEAIRSMVKSGNLDREALAELVDEALDGSRRIERIANDLKLFTRTSRSGETPVRVVDAVGAALRLVANETRHRADVSVSVPDDLYVLAEESKLVQVAVNLVANAAQAFPESDTGEQTIEIEARARGELVQLEISDNGPGMDPETRDKAFEPFFTTKPRIGTGLGLSIVRRLVQEMRGDFELQSEQGSGTTVVITLPKTAAPTTSRSTPSAAFKAARPRRIAIIDDEPHILRALSRLLRQHDVRTFSKGSEFFEQADVASFEVILCDVMMPEEPGPSLWPRFVAEGVSDRVAWMTGGAFTEAAIVFLENAEAPIIEKPISRQALVDLLEMTDRD